MTTPRLAIITSTPFYRTSSTRHVPADTQIGDTVEVTGADTDSDGDYFGKNRRTGNWTHVNAGCLAFLPAIAVGVEVDVATDARSGVQSGYVNSAVFGKRGTVGSHYSDKSWRVEFEGSPSAQIIHEDYLTTVAPVTTPEPAPEPTSPSVEAFTAAADFSDSIEVRMAGWQIVALAWLIQKGVSSS